MPINEIIVLIVFLLIAALIYIVEVSLFAGFVLNKLRGRHRKNLLLTKPAILLHFIAAIGVVCFIYGCFIEPYRIEANNISLRTTKLKQVSFRVVHISDLHCDKKLRNEKKIVKLVNELKPDAIVFTGDAVNYPSALPLFKETMKNLNASMSKLAVLGNWETSHWPGFDYYSQTGFELLNEQTIELEKNGETITVSGLSYDRPENAWRVLQHLSASRFNVFLYHSPELVEFLDGLNVDLYLCGHTHGGQVALPFYGALITMSKSGKKYESGMYSVGKTILYVSRGIGLDAFPAPPVRLFSRPEITVFDIGPEK